MASINLRAYNREIEGLLEHNQVEEAIAHCLHILQFIPKHLGTYRLLGKAFLESKRYGDAIDIFQRLLSSYPDDFVAHVGMSIIREDEGNLDSAIWHMERAFESQPSNAAIQDELRRLYGQRDGLMPPKVRLTRGALARMYIKGMLNQQAIAELRAALSDDPHRTDLQVLLAQAYFADGQNIEAVNTCNSLLKKLPFCLEANRIMAAILPATDQSEEVQGYHQRLVSMDPYYSKITPRKATADEVPDREVMVDHLDYKPGITPSGVAGQPAWAASLGVEIEEKKEQIPDWLTSEKETPPALPSEPETQAPGEPAAPASEAQIPEWMKAAGWQESTGPEQQPPAFEETGPGEEIVPGEVPDWLKGMAPSAEIEEEAPTEPEIPQGDIPAWLQDREPGATDSVVLWLGDRKGEGTPAAEGEAPAEEPLPEWMSGLEMPEAEPFTGATEPAGETPGWLNEISEPEEETGVTDWLEKQARERATRAAEEGIVGEEAEPVEELPDWLKGLEMETPVEEAPAQVESIAAEAPAEPIEALAAEPTEEIPEWLKGPETRAPVEEAPTFTAPAVEEAPTLVEPVTEEAPAEAVEAEATVPTEVPEWLKGLEVEAPIEAAPTPVEPVIEEAPVEPVEAEATVPTEVPEWLKGLEVEAPIEAAPTPVEPVIEEAPVEPVEAEATVPTEVPEWLKGLEVEAPIEAAPTPVESVIEEAPVEPVEAEATVPTEVPEWLKGLEVEAPVEEAPTLVEPVIEEAPVEPIEAAAAVPAEEIPDWLKDLQIEAPVEEAPTLVEPAIEEAPVEPIEAAAAVPAEEIPDWLKGLEVEAPIEAASTPVEPVIEEAPVEPVEAAVAVPAEEIPDWLKDLQVESPVEEALTLEEPVIEEAPVEPVEAAVAVPAEEIPDWLKDLQLEAPVEEAPTPVEPVIEEAPVEPVEAETAIPAGEIPDWLKDLQIEAPVEEAPALVEPVAEEIPVEPVEAQAAIPAGEIPDWLKDLEKEAPVEEAPAEPVEAEAAIPAEEIPDWLKALQAETIAAEAPGEEAPVSEAPEQAPPAITEPPAEFTLEDQDAALAWLEGLAMKQGVPEDQLTTKPEERPSEFMEWKLEEPPISETPAPAEAMEGALPEWLLESKEIAGEEPVAAEPVSEVPAVEGLPEGVNLQDQDAALAWLESLAEKQGVPEEQLTTRPEERPSEVPGWALEEPAPEAVKPEEAVVEPEGAIPEWLLEPEETAAPVAPTEEVPTEAVSEAGMEGAFEWLESLARKHGVPEDQLITHPLKPIEEVPQWIKESASLEDTTPVPIPPIEEGEPLLETPAEVPAIAEETAPVSMFKEITQPAVVEEETQPTIIAEETQPTILPEVTEPSQAEVTQPVPVMEEEITPPVEQVPSLSEQQLDLNSASLSELEALPGIGFVLGQAILAHREAYGPFKTIEDLTNVPGISMDRLDLIRDLAKVTPVAEAVPEAVIFEPRDEDERILMTARTALNSKAMEAAFESYNRLVNQKAYLPEVITDLRASLYGHPREILLWQTLGDACLRSDQLQEALDAYIQAEELLV